MNKSLEVAFGFIVIILVVVGFVIAGISTVPRQQEIDANKKETITIPEDVSQLPIFDEIKKLQRNGNVPVEVAAEELGKTNPFIP